MRSRLLALAWISLALAACSLAGVETPEAPLPTEQPIATLASSSPTEASAALPTSAPPEVRHDLRAGSSIYAEKCAPCHGASGLGDGPQAANLPNPASRLGDPAIARGARPSAWYAMVTDGNLERFMPGFKSLNDAERWSVVAYSLSLSLSPGELEQGQAIYQESCIACHGPEGKGTSGAPDLSAPAMLAGRSLEDLYQVIGRGAGEKMPAFGDSLTDDERWAAAAFVRSLAYGTSGEEAAESAAAMGEPMARTKRISGQVVNGTPGGAVPATMEITLLGWDGEQQVISRITRADQDGMYSFEGVEAEPGRLFAVSARYRGVDYSSEATHLLDEEDELDLPLRIYDATQETSSIRADRLHMLFDFTVPGTVHVVELWVVSNVGDRAVADEKGKGLLRIPLPEGVSDVRFDDQMALEGRFQLEGGELIDTQPLLPGEMTSQVAFSFDMPYERTLDFIQAVSMPIEAVVLFMPEKGPSLKADGLQEMGVQALSGRNLRISSLGAIPADGQIRLTVTGRPSSASAMAFSGSTGNLAIGLVALGLAVLGVGVWWFRPSRRRKEPAGAQVARSRDERESLLQAIADLDDTYAAGNVREAEYRKRRDDLKRQVLMSRKSTDD